ncbi:MAG: hypothetical protein J6A19_10175 [Oscillospiraceae bacterium]|nr:hypothetical protein [Oscillospiraceae bacterium]
MKSERWTSSVSLLLSKQKFRSELRTERQWAKAGFLALSEDCGKKLRPTSWSTGSIDKLPRYLLPEEVRAASADELAAYFQPERERKAAKAAERRAKQAEMLADLKFVSESDIIELLDGNSQQTSTAHTINPEQHITQPNITEKKKTTANQYAKKITLKRKEVTEIIGDELTNDEISEFFYFCLQKPDVLNEWRRMYQQNSEQHSDVSSSGEDEDTEEGV